MTTERIYRDDERGIRAADDPDIEVLAQLLFEKRGPGRRTDPLRRSHARRLLVIIREFLNRTARQPKAEGLGAALDALEWLGTDTESFLRDHRRSPNGGDVQRWHETALEVRAALGDFIEPQR